MSYPPGIYFLTGSTFLHYPYFKTDEQKEIVREQIVRLSTEFDIPICAYSIQLNHYHLVFYSKKREDITRVKRYMHGAVLGIYKNKFERKGPEFWGTRKIIRIWNTQQYWSVIGYVCGNLIKHKEFGTFDELKQSRFTSYGHFAGKYGDDMMKEIVNEVIHVDEYADGIVDSDSLFSDELLRLVKPVLKHRGL